MDAKAAETAEKPNKVATTTGDNENQDLPRKVLFVSKDLSLAELKTRAKKYNATINDWFMACLTIAVKKYHEKQEGKVPQPQLRAETIISTHTDVNIDRFEPDNKITAAQIIMDFQDDVDGKPNIQGAIDQV